MRTGQEKKTPKNNWRYVLGEIDFLGVAPGWGKLAESSTKYNQKKVKFTLKGRIGPFLFFFFFRTHQPIACMAGGLICRLIYLPRRSIQVVTEKLWKISLYDDGDSIKRCRPTLSTVVPFVHIICVAS